MSDMTMLKDKPLTPDTEKDDDNVIFAKNLCSSLYRNPAAANTLKRMLGRPATADMGAYLAYLPLTANMETPPSGKNEDIHFLVACLFYNTERRRNEEQRKDEDNRTYVKMEQLLGRMYRGQSDSTKRTIESFMLCDLNSERFTKQFTSLSLRAIKELRAGERLNYVKLVKDLCFWDSNKNFVKRNWAKAIIVQRS